MARARRRAGEEGGRSAAIAGARPASSRATARPVKGRRRRASNSSRRARLCVEGARPPAEGPIPLPLGAAGGSRAAGRALVTPMPRPRRPERGGLASASATPADDGKPSASLPRFARSRRPRPPRRRPPRRPPEHRSPRSLPGCKLSARGAHTRVHTGALRGAGGPERRVRGRLGAGQSSLAAKREEGGAEARAEAAKTPTPGAEGGKHRGAGQVGEEARLRPELAAASRGARARARALKNARAEGASASAAGLPSPRGAAMPPARARLPRQGAGRAAARASSPPGRGGA